ncbi:WD40 repeat domain-containing protein [Actinoplanes sp. NPDC026670]|uniref:WD40 repeat domain-containing protein n=1 Tax=Actinoplanes sp. NPDC026670 TaxID=3154700 RepID=UPI0033CA5C6F
MSEDDPVQVFAARLRRLQIDSGGPSVRDLERLTGKVGSPYTRGTIQDKLTGRSAPSAEFVEAFVLACALHQGAPDPDLGRWTRWHAVMTRDVAEARVRRRAVPTESCPFRGLETFTAEHATFFHGRDVAIQRVLAGLAAHPRGVLLLGPSGAGKSSLVQAGVLPALADGQLPGSDRWTTVVTRPGQDLLAALDSGGRRLVVVDQFEELLAPGGGREVLDRLTAVLGDEDPDTTVILVMRDDFYPRLASEAPALLDLMAPGVVNVPTMLGMQDLRDIVTRPAVAAALTYQEGLAERIITDTLAVDRQAPATVLPLLELTLEQLWQRRERGCLTHEAYQRIGGVSGALAMWCDTALQQLPPDRRPTAQRILTALVRPADEAGRVPAARQRVPIAVLRDLARPPGDAVAGVRMDPADDDVPAGRTVDEVLAALTAYRLVTTGVTDPAGVPTAELVHDALIRDWAVLRGWVNQDHRFQDWLRRAGERHTRWVASHHPGDLLQGTDLAEGTDWSARRTLPEPIAGFLAMSRQNQLYRTRRAHRITAALAVLLVVSLTATGIALWHRRAAITAQGTALSRQLAAQSTALAASDPDLAALLAIRAYQVEPTAEALSSLYTAAARPLRHSLAGHPGSVRSIVFSPDGGAVATSGDDGTARIWGAGDGQLRGVLTGHTGAVLSVVFSPDGRTLITGGQDGTVRLWDTAGAARGILTHHTGAVLSVAFSPDGRTVAVAGGQGMARLWDVDAGEVRADLVGHTGDVRSIAFGPDGRTLATGGQDGTVRQWDAETGALRATVSHHRGAVLSVVFSPDGRTLASSGQDRVIRLWDVAGLRLHAPLPGHAGEVHSLAFSPDGRSLASSGDDDTTRLWDVAGQTARSLLTGGVTAVAFSPDGTTLATGGASGTARLWDVTGGQTRIALTGHTGAVTAVAFSPDGGTLASAGNDGRIRFWGTADGRSGLTLAGHVGPVEAVAFSPDGRTLASGGLDGRIRFWGTADGSSRLTLSRHLGPVAAVVFSPDGATLATGGADTTTRLWDVAAGQTRATMTPPKPRPVSSLAFSPDGGILAASGTDHRVRLWDTRSGQVVVRLDGHTGAVTAVAFSPDGRTLATVGVDATIRLWDTATGRFRSRLDGHTGAVLSVVFSPDGRTLATGGVDTTVRLWDTATGQFHTRLDGHRGAVSSVAFSPDGHTLASAGEDATVRLWQVTAATPAAAVEKICRAIARDITPEERAVYLPPGDPSTPICHDVHCSMRPGIDTAIRCDRHRNNNGNRPSTVRS